MGSPDQSKPFAILLALVVASLLLVVLGFWLRRRGTLASRGAALGWAILCIAPLFGGGALMLAGHLVERATGETRSGQNNDLWRRPGR